MGCGLILLVNGDPFTGGGDLNHKIVAAIRARQSNIGGRHIRQLKPVNFSQRLAIFDDGVASVAFGPDITVTAICGLCGPVTTVKDVTPKPPLEGVIAAMPDKTVITVHPMEVVPVRGTGQRFTGSGTLDAGAR